MGQQVPRTPIIMRTAMTMKTPSTITTMTTMSRSCSTTMKTRTAFGRCLRIWAASPFPSFLGRFSPYSWRC